MIFNGFDADKPTKFDRNLFRIIKLKNNLLIKHDTQSTEGHEIDAESVIMAVSFLSVTNLLVLCVYMYWSVCMLQKKCILY